MNSFEKKKVPRLGLGTWLSTGSPVVAELAGACSLDWLLFDLEHGCLTESGLLANLQAVRNPEVTLVVRVGSLDPALIARALDWGASGIMLPHVSTPAQASACVAAMRYPPHGTRGYSGSVRAYAYGLCASKVIQELPAPVFMAQLEDYEGVMNAEAIAGVSGVDVLFVGPADLKLDLAVRCPSKPSLPFTDALARVSQAAQKNGKQAGILVRNPADIPELRKAGFSCLAIGSDLGILRDGFQTILTL
ncbi:HpcH/HpaI aldolase family protein [Larkinella punicea]|uniref:HpcH/HpaI aldolase/citrate lyase domain-containing protein n=1 Tax=Larkinella punicea TaxID=2315727 RepID=A0A368JW83_9BACT|nr:aldolase/citrate lyase family protein [Larkinella punicea]RCR71615.1 hypothetical protein DUE52_01455 [Larkinella punicea]